MMAAAWAHVAARGFRSCHHLRDHAGPPACVGRPMEPQNNQTGPTVAASTIHGHTADIGHSACTDGYTGP